MCYVKYEHKISINLRRADINYKSCSVHTLDAISCVRICLSKRLNYGFQLNAPSSPAAYCRNCLSTDGCLLGAGSGLRTFYVVSVT